MKRSIMIWLIAISFLLDLFSFEICLFLTLIYNKSVTDITELFIKA